MLRCRDRSDLDDAARVWRKAKCELGFVVGHVIGHVIRRSHSQFAMVASRGLGLVDRAQPFGDGYRNGTVCAETGIVARRFASSVIGGIWHDADGIAILFVCKRSQIHAQPHCFRNCTPGTYIVAGLDLGRLAELARV